MHSVALTVAEPLAGGAVVLFHPAAVAVGTEAVFPNVDEIVLVDVALMVVATDAGTGGDGSIGKNRSDSETCLTHIEVVANLALILTEEAFAGIARADAAFVSRADYEVHQTSKFLRSELKLGVFGRASRREDGEEAPGLYAGGYQDFFKFFEMRKVAAVHAGYDIEDDAASRKNHCCIQGAGEAARHAPHPVVVGFGPSIETVALPSPARRSPAARSLVNR